MNPRPLGYEPYDARLPRLGQSPVAALASADGRQAFIPGLQGLPRLNPSRYVSCTNPCTNLGAESLAVRTQIPSRIGAECELPRSARRSDAHQQTGVYFGEHEIRTSKPPLVRSVRRNPYWQVSVLSGVRHVCHSPVRSVREKTVRDSDPRQWPLPADRRRDDKSGRWVERDLGSTGHQHVRVVPGPLTGQERFLLGHPLPMIPDRQRPAGLPDARQAPALGFQLVGLYPHQYIDQVRDLGQLSPGCLRAS